MNNRQNQQNPSAKFRIPRGLIWGGGVGAIVIAFVVFLVILMSSSETPTAFLAKWKSALESESVKRYDALWIKNARQRPDTGYQETVGLLKGGARLEVNLGGATQTFRVPRYPNRYRIEGIPVTVHFSGESQQQLRNLVIEKQGLVQRRWKIIQDEVVGSDFVATLPETTPPQQDDTQPDSTQPDSPVLPVVQRWKSALESQDVKTYTDLWDKSARRNRASSFRRATELMSQTHVVNLTEATYTPIPRQKNRHVVDNINVTLQSGESIIETHVRTLTIQKKGFFRREWKIINDQVGEMSDAIALAPNVPSAGADTVSGEASGNAFDGNAPIDTQLKVRQVLGKWQKAWEDKDLNTYMSIYSERSRITRVTVRGGKETSIHLSKGELRTKMEKINNIYAEIQVSISNLQVNGDRAVADVQFLQKFTGTRASGSRPAYSDYGTKKLNLMVDPTDGHWRIYSETWSRYEDVPDFPKM